ncbi:unnamed protein product [Brassica oleracea var. botrytis]
MAIKGGSHYHHSFVAVAPLDLTTTGAAMFLTTTVHPFTLP